LYTHPLLLLFDTHNFVGVGGIAVYRLIDCLLFIISILLCVAFFTLAERKGMASIQRRIGPNIVGIWGVLQPFADALKLLVKEIVIPAKSNKILFLFCPLFNLCCSFFGWFPLVLNSHLDGKFFIFNYGLLLNFFFSTLSIYFLFLIG